MLKYSHPGIHLSLGDFQRAKLINLTLWSSLGAIGQPGDAHSPTPQPDVTAGMRIDCVSPIRPLCGIYKSAPRWREPANDGSKISFALRPTATTAPVASDLRGRETRYLSAVGCRFPLNKIKIKIKINAR